MLWLDEKFVYLISHKLDRFKKRGRQFNFRCPLCHDSKKSKSKARGYFYVKEDNYIFFCHNCGKGKSLEKFLLEFDYALYEQYSYERLQEAGERHNFSPSHPSQNRKLPTESVLSPLKAISKLTSSHPARKYLEGRKIPSKFFSELYYCDNFKQYVNSLIPNKFEKVHPDEPRIIIPLITPNRNVVGFQGRGLNKQGVRYYTIILHENLGRIYGLNHVNLNRTFYVMEGPFDSLFVENAMAVCGSDIVTALIKIDADIERAVVVYDNEPRNREIVSKYQHTIRYGWSVCIWPNDFEYKDINDAIMGGLHSDQILTMINENTYQGLEAELALANWRKT